MPTKKKPKRLQIYTRKCECKERQKKENKNQTEALNEEIKMTKKKRKRNKYTWQMPSAKQTYIRKGIELFSPLSPINFQY